MRFLIILFALITASFSTKDRCGEGYGSCDEDECCSEYGWCGLTEEHCGTGCQSAYGHCDNNSKDRCGNEYGNVKIMNAVVNMDGVEILMSIVVQDANLNMVIVNQ